MARKIRFPLEMKNGVMVRTLEELKENFNLEKVIIYFTTGKLITWLNDRYYEEEAQQILKLDANSEDFNKIICEIFEIEYCEEIAIDIEEIERLNFKKSKLKQYTEDEEILDNIDKVALDQEELADLLDEGNELVYLCGEKFTIPLRVEGVTYIGVNNPAVIIKSKELIDFKSKKITLKEVIYNEEYQALINKEESKKSTHKTINNDKFIKSRSSQYEYKISKELDFMMTNKDRKFSRNLFDIIVNELCEVTYD